MNIIENPREVLTTCAPITFDQAIIELCQFCGCADTPDLRSWFDGMQPDEIVLWTVVLEEDPGKHDAVLYLEKALPEPNGRKKIPGYFIYQSNKDAIIEPRIEIGYKGNLTAEEECELANIFTMTDWDDDTFDRYRDLIWQKKYPLSTAERTARNEATKDPSKIGNYLTLNQIIPLEQAKNELNNLYSSHGRKLDELNSGGDFSDLRSQARLTIIASVDSMPLAVHLERFIPDKEIPGLTLYPLYLGAEKYDFEYSFALIPGTKGILSEAEELELAHIVYERNYNKPPRQDELCAIRKGSLTREEAAELKTFLESDIANNNGRMSLNWTGWPERPMFLMEKYCYGCKSDFTIEQWREWKKKCAEITRQASEEWRQSQIKERDEIAACLPERLKVLFGTLVPTNGALKRIEKEESKYGGPWELVAVKEGGSASSAPAFLAPYIESSDLRCEDGESAYGPNVYERNISLFFARREVLKSAKCSIVAPTHF